MITKPTPNVEEWEPWTPRQLEERFRGCRAFWAVAGGWALDLWFGGCTRAHGDIEIAVARSALSAMCDRLSGHVLYEAKDGRLEPFDVAGEDVRQVWVLDQVARKWRLDLMLDPGDDTRWIYRRDARIQAPRSDVVGWTVNGIPYLSPHVVLLFKGKDPRPKDHSDLATCLDKLENSQRTWLREALLTAHPRSPWLGLL